jgi:uncharacterized membrane protein YkvA (DUF1232 family)
MKAEMEKSKTAGENNAIVSIWERIKRSSHELKNKVYGLYFASQDKRTPWYAKVLAIIVVAYALSPIDLVPDFIPVLGYLDDLILVPAGMVLVLKLIPGEVMAEALEKSKRVEAEGSVPKWIGAAIVVLIWLIGTGVLALLVAELSKVF